MSTDVSPPEAGALLEGLILAVLQASFRVRAAGRSVGAVNRWGGGYWGLLRSLAIAGPASVPQLARQRPVSRQRIQHLVDDALAAGDIELIDNPRHKRSRLVKLTPQGEQTYDAVSARVRSACVEFAQAFDTRDIVQATATVRRLSEMIGQASLPGRNASHREA